MLLGYKKFSVNDRKYALVVQRCTVDWEEKARYKGTHHIWLTDCSGSMHRHMETMKKNLISMANTLCNKDTLSLGWFSSEGCCGFYTEGVVPVTTKGTLTSSVQTAIESLGAVGCTQFSGILARSVQVIQRLSKDEPDKNISLTFFTDGYPTVARLDEEIAIVKAMLSALAPILTSSLYVSYGADYNLSLMSAMAETTTGGLVCSSDFNTYIEKFKGFVEEASGVTGRSIVPQDIAGTVLTAIKLTSKGYLPIAHNENGFVVPITDSSTVDVGYIVECAKELPDASLDDVKDPYRYAAYLSVMASQQRRGAVATKIAGITEDVALIKKASTSFAKTDFEGLQAYADTVCNSVKKRYAKGRSDKFIPADDAYCLLDLLDDISNDPTFTIYPKSSDFSYKAETKTVTDAGLKVDKDAGAKLCDLVWNKQRLNLSVLTLQKGKYTLPKNNVGLSTDYPVAFYRNYTLIRDGSPNLTRLPITCSDELKQKLADLGCISDSEKCSVEGGVILDFTQIPVVNNQMLRGDVSAHELAKDTYTEMSIQGEIKVYKHLLKNLKPEDSDEPPTTISEQQIKFLAEHGISPSGIYSSKSKRDCEEPYEPDVPDIYFKIGLAGLSSLPAVPAVMEKMKRPTSLTKSEKLIAEPVKKYETTFASGGECCTVDHKILWLANNLEDAKKRLKVVRKSIQSTRFKVIMCGMWFTELERSVQDQCSFEVPELDKMKVVFNFSSNIG